MFLPVSKKEIEERGWDYYDFLYVIGDAYVDHSSFGPAIISRCLEAAGYRVAILSQPDWHTADDFKAFPKPRLGVLISGGNMDSMVNHYTAAKKPRSSDAYSPGGKMGMRPDRCTIVYANRAREAFGNIPLIIGGIEASLRRFAHYDYWSDSVRRSILIDSRADIICYGMGEKSIVQIADALSSGISIADITYINGTVYRSDTAPDKAVIMPSFENVRDSKKEYAVSALLQYKEQDPVRGKVLCQKHGDKFIVQNPPAMPLTQEEMDFVYELPYEMAWHPSCKEEIPAFSEVKFSITSSRGCFGSCNFCAITFHQGRMVTSRSHESVLKEAEKLTTLPDFKGYIHDVGGPTANFRAPSCPHQLTKGTCKDRQCLFPSPCKALQADHSDYIELLRKLRKLPKVKKVFIRSGLRFDYILADPSDEFLYELCRHHISGQLKVAPEHISDKVLSVMGKPENKVYEKFSKKFYDVNNKINKEQYLIPYLMSSHPGSELSDAICLALYLRKNNLRPQQVQDFYPTPGTISTAMYYTELNPFTLKKIYVPKTFEEKAMQRALLQCTDEKNYNTVYKALTMAGRSDLIGYSPTSLIKPREENKDDKNIRRKNGFPKNKKSTGRRGNKSQKAKY